MKYSKLFGKTRHSPPCDADSVNAKLLTQAGFIEKLAAGIYNFLPLGKRVLEKINKIIREEMDAVEGQEILMPSLHPIELWQTTGRDKTMDEILYRTRASGDKEFVFGPSHEETVTPLAAKYIKSYKDMPLSIYQIQTKFRDEPRAKSGLLRGREFGMKDMYSFHASDEDLDDYYEKVKQSYSNVFTRCGLNSYIIEASGGPFSDKYSHEFSIETKAGEDTVIICKKCGIAQNLELVEVKSRLNCVKCGSSLEEMKAVEAGNIFKLGTRYSDAFNLKFTDKDGKVKPVIMGCYGIGNTRLLGTIVEAKHDENGIIWPLSVAPYAVSLILLGQEKDVVEKAEEVYEKLLKENIEVLFDERDESPGVKFKDADLIGIPLRLVVSKRSLEKDGVEWKERDQKESKIVTMKGLYKELEFALRGSHSLSSNPPTAGRLLHEFLNK
ncbi:hypothetical protein HZC20_00660 [Candidatus Peregrinibacteria bacterium]|nr:hypothetical protein [Candidatus Peregrinibacteria bacterium]